MESLPHELQHRIFTAAGYHAVCVFEASCCSHRAMALAVRAEMDAAPGGAQRRFAAQMERSVELRSCMSTLPLSELNRYSRYWSQPPKAPLPIACAPPPGTEELSPVHDNLQEWRFRDLAGRVLTSIRVRGESFKQPLKLRIFTQPIVAVSDSTLALFPEDSEGFREILGHTLGHVFFPEHVDLQIPPYFSQRFSLQFTTVAAPAATVPMPRLVHFPIFESDLPSHADETRKTFHCEILAPRDGRVLLSVCDAERVPITDLRGSIHVNTDRFFLRRMASIPAEAARLNDGTYQLLLPVLPDLHRWMISIEMDDPRPMRVHTTSFARDTFCEDVGKYSPSMQWAPLYL